MAAHQAPPSLGFSRQEHWSGLPFPSPVGEREKWKGSRSVVSDPSRPHGLQATRLLRPWDFPGKSTGVGCHCLIDGLSCQQICAKQAYLLPQKYLPTHDELHSRILLFWDSSGLKPPSKKVVFYLLWDWLNFTHIQRSTDGTILLSTGSTNQANFGVKHLFGIDF